MMKERGEKHLAALSVKVSTGIDLGHLEIRIQEAIAHRAYDLFEKRERQHGSDLADWFRAEEEIQRPDHVVIREGEGAINVRVQAPGFAPGEMEVGVSHNRVVIWGLKLNSGRAAGSVDAPLVGAGFGAFLADVRLPSSVNPVKSTADLVDGWVEIQLTKET